jgi:hypothetical protein
MVPPIRTGAFPSALGLSVTSGLLANIWTRTAKRAAQDVGEAALKQMLRKAGTKLVGKIFLKSQAWKVAFVHVAEHFTLKALATKETHTVFVKALRSEKALEKLIVKAIRGPSRKYISRATVHNVTAGKPVIILEREFKEVIGETFARSATGPVRRGECRFLRVIVEVATGRPVTAYPIEALGAVL